MAFQFQKHETLHKRQNTQQPHHSKRIIQFKAKYSAVLMRFILYLKGVILSLRVYVKIGIIS